MPEPITDPNNPPAAAAPAPAAGITQEAHHTAIEKARLEERAKLREQITALEGKVKELDADNKTLSATNSKLTTDLETLKASLKPEGDGVDIEKLIEKMEARFEQKYATDIASLKDQLAGEQQVREKLSLEQLKARLIQQNGGEDAMISELVSGTNAAEIQASIEVAKEKHQKILKKAGAPPSTQQNNGQGSGGNPPPNPPVPSGGAGAPAGGGAAETLDVRNMSMEDYKKHRATITKKASSRYAANYIRQ